MSTFKKFLKKVEEMKISPEQAKATTHTSAVSFVEEEKKDFSSFLKKVEKVKLSPEQIKATTHTSAVSFVEEEG